MSATVRPRVTMATGKVSANLRALFAANLRNARCKARLTQEELAERTQITQSGISAIENGGRNVTLRTIAVLATAIEVDVWRLLTPPRRRGTGRR